MFSERLHGLSGSPRRSASRAPRTASAASSPSRRPASGLGRRPGPAPSSSHRPAKALPSQSHGLEQLDPCRQQHVSPPIRGTSAMINYNHVGRAEQLCNCENSADIRLADLRRPARLGAGDEQSPRRRQHLTMSDGSVRFVKDSIALPASGGPSAPGTAARSSAPTPTDPVHRPRSRLSPWSGIADPGPRARRTTPPGKKPHAPPAPRALRPVRGLHAHRMRRRHDPRAARQRQSRPAAGHLA